jgi:hypothetical protein
MVTHIQGPDHFLCHGQGLQLVYVTPATVVPQKGNRPTSDGRLGRPLDRIRTTGAHDFMFSCLAGWVVVVCKTYVTLTLLDVS